MTDIKTLSIGFDSPDSVLGEWTRFIPQRVGHSSAIDAALECFLNCLTTYVNLNTENLVLTENANAKAIVSIRAAIESGNSDLLQNDVLIAISLLPLVEAFLRGSTGHYKFHQTGLISLVQRVSSHDKQCNEGPKYIPELTKHGCMSG